MYTKQIWTTNTFYLYTYTSYALTKHRRSTSVLAPAASLPSLPNLPPVGKKSRRIHNQLKPINELVPVRRRSVTERCDRVFCEYN